jgi:hypothetical protein
MIIWLASYPKSGNTWVRSIIASLIYTNDGIFNFDLLENIRQFPTAKHFRRFTNDIGNLNEIMKYWIKAQDFINLDNKVKFFKTHHLNCKIGKSSFTNKENTLATIYIVRDPRNLVSSISNHYSKSLEESKNFLLSPRYIGGYKKFGEKKKENLTSILGSWQEHYKFWKKNNDSYLLIRYEDLITKPLDELIRIINFLKKFMSIETNTEKNNNIIKTTNFKNLQLLEGKGRFKENAYESTDNKIKFFNLGPENNWENSLDFKIKNEIEQKLSNEMKELGYLK